MEEMNYTWILASNSPRRKELLGELMGEMIILAADVDEEIEPGTAPGKIVEELAGRKAHAVFDHLYQLPEIIERDPKNKDDYRLMLAKEFVANKVYAVIGADTLVYHKGEVLGKPKDKEDAFRMLKSLSGDTHSVFTGVCILTPEEKLLFHSETKVTFVELPDEEILEYIETGEPMDKAGAYGIQGSGGTFVTGIEGDYTNVVGFPIGEFCHLIRTGAIKL